MDCFVRSIIFCFSLFVVSYCNPIKRQSPEQGATDECYGTQCYYDDLDDTETINVNFPENLTEAVLLALPDILHSQNEMVILHNKTLVSQDKVMDLLEYRLENMETGLQQIKNVTTTMTELMGNMANLLQNQLDILRIGLPPARDCQDIAAHGGYKSGAYVISPPDGLGSFEVYCDLIDNEGWTVFQKRFDGSVDFYRNWTQYEEGFGDVNGEYWLGLKNIRRLTSYGTTWALHIDLESFDEDFAYAFYDAFSVSDAASYYILSIGEYSGNAGDSLNSESGSNSNILNGMPFTTLDKDNDNYPGVNCAYEFKGGWWYNCCFAANLNGEYLSPTGVQYWKGTIWSSWKKQKSLKATQMKIRRVQ